MSDSTDLPGTPNPTPVSSAASESPAGSSTPAVVSEETKQSHHDVPALEAPKVPVIKPPFPTLLGIDFGSTKIVTAFARHNSTDLPTIVRNETADLYTTNLLSFKGEERLLGEAAAGHVRNSYLLLETY